MITSVLAFIVASLLPSLLLLLFFLRFLRALTTLAVEGVVRTTGLALRRVAHFFMTNQSMCKGGKKKSKKRYDGRWCDDHHLRWMRIRVRLIIIIITTTTLFLFFFSLYYFLLRKLSANVDDAARGEEPQNHSLVVPGVLRSTGSRGDFPPGEPVRFFPTGIGGEAVHVDGFARSREG